MQSLYSAQNANSYQVEPELLRPLPRPVRRRRGHLNAIGCIQIFIIPHSIVGIGSLFWALFSTLVLVFGQVVPGQITGHRTKSSDDGTDYHLDYTYSVAGASYSSSAIVSRADYDSYPDGYSVTVRVLPMVPHRGAILLVQGTNPKKHVLTLWGFTLFWNAILSVFWWFAYVAPHIMKKIVATGTPTAGRITQKEVISGDDSDSYMLHYEYSPATTDAGNSWNQQPVPVVMLLNQKMAVTKDEHNTACVGDVVTVLYLPNKPKRSAVYRYAEYEVATS